MVIKRQRDRQLGKRTSRGPQAISELIPQISKKFSNHRGFLHPEILTCWPEIIGNKLALDTTPKHILFKNGKRQGGTLYVSASGPAALQLLHDEPVILQRINSYFGYDAIEKISITQLASRDLSSKLEISKDQNIPDKNLKEIESRTKIISDRNLRDALNMLGIALNADIRKQKLQK
ncbi:MAG: hypothetical protein CMM83_05020 [Rhodospirillales bacterium]|nr:hypothetical protein [Rhodospirillales bacterium]